MVKIEKSSFNWIINYSMLNNNLEITATNITIATWLQDPQKASYSPNGSSSCRNIRKQSV